MPPLLFLAKLNEYIYHFLHCKMFLMMVLQRLKLLELKILRPVDSHISSIILTFSSCLKACSCSSSTIIKPKFEIGIISADLAPTITPAVPFNADNQIFSFFSLLFQNSKLMEQRKFLKIFFPIWRQNYFWE